MEHWPFYINIVKETMEREPFYIAMVKETMEHGHFYIEETMEHGPCYVAMNNNITVVDGAVRCCFFLLLTFGFLK